MNRIFCLTLAATTLVGLGACNSDTKTSISKVSVASDGSVASDLSLPSDLTLPTGLAGDCRAIYAQMIAAMAQAFAPAGEQVDVAKVFGDVEANVPDELKGEVAIMSAAMKQLGEVMKQYNNDMSNPEVMKAMQELSTPEVAAASENLSAYFETTCPKG